MFCLISLRFNKLSIISIILFAQGLLGSYLNPPSFFIVINMRKSLKQVVHVVFHGLGAQSPVHERLIAELEDVLGPQLQDGAAGRGADGRFSVGLLLVEEDLLAHGLPEEAGVVQVLHLVVRKVAEAHLAVHDEIDVVDRRVLLVQHLSLLDLDNLTQVEDHLVGVVAELPKNRVMKPDFLEVEILLGALSRAHDFLVTVQDLAHELVLLGVEGNPSLRGPGGHYGLILKFELHQLAIIDIGPLVIATKIIHQLQIDHFVGRHSLRRPLLQGAAAIIVAASRYLKRNLGTPLPHPLRGLILGWLDWWQHSTAFLFLHLLI